MASVSWKVLIAVLVLAIRFIGLCITSTDTVNTNLDAYFQSQATILGNDLGSRIYFLNGNMLAGIPEQIPREQPPLLRNESKVGDRNVYVLRPQVFVPDFFCSVTGPSSLTSGGPLYRV